MSSTLLNADTINNYLKNIPIVQSLLATDQLTVKEIGDGNVNYIFIASNNQDPKKAVIVKHAAPYLRCIGESYALSSDRLLYETASLKEFSKLAPAHVPSVYHIDEEMNLFVMQYLGDHIIMRKGLMQKVKYPHFADHASTFLSEVLFKTSSLYLTSTAKRQLMQKFSNNADLCLITERFVFTFPYMQHETNFIIPEMKHQATLLFSDNEFKQSMLDLKYKFMNQTDALIHGDLHTGSIMVNADQTFVIDSEFAFFGPFGFDVGAILANLILSYVSHYAQTPQDEYLDWLLTTITELMTQFEKKFLHLWHQQQNSALIIDGYLDQTYLAKYKHDFMHKLFQDAVAFAGCKMARRIFGVAGVADIRDIQDANIRSKAETHALNIAKLFVKRYTQINSMSDVKEIIHAECPNK